MSRSTRWLFMIKCAPKLRNNQQSKKAIYSKEADQTMQQAENHNEQVKRVWEPLLTPTVAKAKQAVENFRSEINAAEEKPIAVITVGEAWAHFQANELRDPDVDRSPTTIQSYLDYFKARILPKWKDVSLDDVKSFAGRNR